MPSATLPASVRAFLATSGRSGGTKGKRSAKRRGDSAHYRAMARKRWHETKRREAILSHLTMWERNSPERSSQMTKKPRYWQFEFVKWVCCFLVVIAVLLVGYRLVEYGVLPEDQVEAEAEKYDKKDSGEDRIDRHKAEPSENRNILCHTGHDVGRRFGLGPKH